MRPRRVIITVRTSDEARVAEALRAAVGVTLRGDSVAVYLAAAPPSSPRIARATDTLRLLGHTVREGSPGAALRAADAVEVWT